MKSNASVEERFDGWYVNPIKLLHDGLPESNKDFKSAAAKDFGLQEDEFEAFWKVYRNGTQHQGIPMDQEYKGKKYKWQTRYDFNAIPSFQPLGQDTYEIRLNPWKFADLIIDKYKKDKSILTKFFDHGFAAVN